MAIYLHSLLVSVSHDAAFSAETIFGGKEKEGERKGVEFNGGWKRGGDEGWEGKRGLVKKVT